MRQTIYLLAVEDRLEPIMASLRQAFGAAAGPAQGNRMSLTLQGSTAQLLVATRTMGEELDKLVRDQTDKVWQHFHTVQTEKTDLKINLLHQLRLTRALIQLQCDGLPEGLYAGLFAAAKACRGVLLVRSASAICNADGALLLDDNGASEVEAFFPLEVSIPVEYWQGAQEEQIQRRGRSMALAREHGVYVTQWLPLLPCAAQAHCRSPQEVAQRAVALLAVSLYAECLLGEKFSVEESRAFLQDAVGRFAGIEGFFSPAERAYLSAVAPTESDSIQFLWQYENCWVMEWALGLADTLDYPDHICDVPQTVHLLRGFDSMEALLAASHPRTPEELLDAADLIYRLDWACVDARLNGLPAPAGLDDGVVTERHRALNWLIGDGDAPWDEVDIST